MTRRLKSHAASWRRRRRAEQHGAAWRRAASRTSRTASTVTARVEEEDLNVLGLAETME
jgi:hypothetical protein